MNFIAIDFKTASEKRHGTCSLGLTVITSYDRGKIFFD